VIGSPRDWRDNAGRDTLRSTRKKRRRGGFRARSREGAELGLPSFGARWSNTATYTGILDNLRKAFAKANAVSRRSAGR